MCPICGADQAHPIQIADPNSPQPLTLPSFIQEWSILILLLVADVGGMAGILWHNFGRFGTSPAMGAAEVGAKSLRDVREALSDYALSASAYPPTLDSLGGRMTLPLQTLRNSGYKLEYTPKASGGAYRGFTILARPERSDYLNLYVDESGVVRATPENRAAAERDPPL